MIKIKNPEWEPKLKALTKRVADGLGCHGKFEAKFKKLLIFKTRSHLKIYTETDIEENMLDHFLSSCRVLMKGFKAFILKLK